MSEGLAEIYDDYREDPAFAHLRTPGIVLVPGEGASSNPKAMIVGEAPGAMENTHRRPFVGASGRVLRSLISDAAELSAEDYFITNTVKYRPPGNRNPEAGEIVASIPYLRREFSALGGPQVIVAVGGIAFMAFRPKAETRGILAAAGQMIDLPGGRYLLPMIHPAYGLRNPNARPKMQADWEEFGLWMKERLP